MERSIPDFEKLEKDVIKAINDDELYWLRNDAKFRAVDQRVPTYEDFRDIVNAAHLKPLDKKESIRVLPKTVWNTSANVKNNKKNPKNDKTVEKETMKIPTTNTQFIRDFKQTKHENRFNYIEFIGCDRIRKLHKSELSFELMGEIIVVIESHVKDKPEFIIQLLKTMSESQRFNLDIELMSSVEKNACKLLFNGLKELKISDKMNIIKELEKKYIKAITSTH